VETLVKAVEAQLLELDTRYRLRAENAEDATDAEIEEARETDDQTYIGLSRLLRTVLEGQATKLPIEPLVPIVERSLTTGTDDLAAKRWSLRFLNDLVEFLGPASAPIVAKFAHLFVDGLKEQGE
jgi:hypothetical protein